MAEAGIVRRYARALFDVAHQRGAVEPVRGDLEALGTLLQSTPQLGRVLRAPTIPPARKRQLLRTAFGGRVHELTQRFLDMIVEKRREEILGAFYKAMTRAAEEPQVPRVREVLGQGDAGKLVVGVFDEFLAWCQKHRAPLNYP